MISRLKRQTKRRHSVLGGRKLMKRRIVRIIAERVAAKVTAVVSLRLGITEPIIGARFSPDVWAL